MSKLPNPPAVGELQRIPPEIKRVGRGTLVWRIYFRAGLHATAWNAFRAYGPPTNRFDHHLPPRRTQRRSVLYVAVDGPTCLAEVFQKTRTIDRTIDEPWLVGFRLTRAVRLLNLMGAWPTRAGASMAINSGPRARARLWSRAIYLAYPAVEGIWYGSSMNANMSAAALYERAMHAVPDAPEFHRALSDSALTSVLKRAAARFGYALV